MYGSPKKTRERMAQLGLHRPGATAFALEEKCQDAVYTWHEHEHHQLFYAFSGTARLETRDHVWFLPPHRMAWVPARVTHRTTLRKVHSGSLYFHPSLLPETTDEIRILSVSPLAREMIVHAMRWPVTRKADPLAESFFKTLAGLSAEWLRQEVPYKLPQGKSPAIRRVVEAALEQLDTMTCALAAQKAGMAERTFRRYFSAETGLSWKAFLNQARLLRATEHLARGASVTETSLQVGFQSPSAFAKSFSALLGQTPKAFALAQRHAGAGSLRAKRLSSR